MAKTLLQKLRYAKLTPPEDRAWVEAFNYSLELNKSVKRADKDAYQSVCQQFPRLRAFDKIAK